MEINKDEPEENKQAVYSESPSARESPPPLAFGRDPEQAAECESSVMGKRKAGGVPCWGLLHGEAVGGLPGSGASYAMVGGAD